MGLWLPPNRGNHSPGRGLGSPIVSQQAPARQDGGVSKRQAYRRPPTCWLHWPSGAIGPQLPDLASELELA
ncbi:hypothetical protein NEUTE2DRAFT_127338 [Neurospora tetrasperma FGSC 2509]|nr:hypothetical protein NEUTE2DRAFT_127338 [Neurospora tetrasperma FGSC 2509]